MACRLPGGLDAPDKLWDALLRGEDYVTVVPLDRWDPQEYYDPEPGVPGRSVSKWGAVLNDVGGFDAEFFGISEREAEVITAWLARGKDGKGEDAKGGDKREE